MFLSPLRALTTILSCFCFTCNEQFFPTKWHWERCGWSSWPRKDKFFHYKSYLVLRLREIVLEVFNLCLRCLFLSIKLMRQPTWSTHKRGLIFECEREMKFFPTGMKMNQQNDLAMKKKIKIKAITSLSVSSQLFLRDRCHLQAHQCHLQAHLKLCLD